MSLENNLKEKENKIVEIKENEIIKNENISTDIIENKKTLSTLSIFGILLSIFIIILLTIFLIFSFSNMKNENIFSGIYIKNIDVSNLSKNDATKKLNEYIQNYLPEEIILKHGDYETSINLSDLNIKFNINEAVDLSYNIGRNKNFIKNNFEVLSTLIVNKNIEPTFSLDTERLKKDLDNISTKLPDKIIESSYYIDNNNLIITKGQDGNIVDEWISTKEEHKR